MHRLYLRNMVSAQRRNDYSEACRWSVFAERERAISKWEAEQEELLKAAEAQNTNNQGFILTDELNDIDDDGDSEDYGINANWDEAYTSASSTRPSTSSTHGLQLPQYQQQQQQHQMVIEVPTPPMDRSSNLRPEVSNDTYEAVHNSLLNPLQSLNIPHQRHVHTPHPQYGYQAQQDNTLLHGGVVTADALPPRLTRSSSMQRHIPATSLRMAPTPLRPRIDHHAVSYPSPQATRLSYVQPSNPVTTNTSANGLQMPVYGLSETMNNSTSSSIAASNPAPMHTGIPGLTSIASTAVSSQGPDTPINNNNIIPASGFVVNPALAKLREGQQAYYYCS